MGDGFPAEMKAVESEIKGRNFLMEYQQQVSVYFFTLFSDN